MQKFQESIHKFSKDIFDSVLKVKGVDQELALCIAKASVAFQRVIYKAACLSEEDMIGPRLIIQVDAKQYGSRNVLNPPWKDLLKQNPKAHFVTHTLQDNKWSKLTTNGVSKWKRLYIAGMNTIIFRILIKLNNILPSLFFSKQVLIPNENELSIEILSELALKGCKLTEIKKNGDFLLENNEFLEINNAIKALVATRMKEWVIPSLISICEEMFFDEVKSRLNLYNKYVKEWNVSVPKNNARTKNLLMINSPVSTKWLALVSVCRSNDIPVISVQHGVTNEINTSKENDSALDINASDCFIAYNLKSSQVALSSEFNPGKSFISGISGRHLRMKNTIDSENSGIPIVYISTRTYKGNMGGIATWLTDYDVARWEFDLISNVFNELPHKSMYKTYPEETRRYADQDPLVESIFNQCTNVKIFDKKVDMRFLINQHQVFVTSFATSTLSWVIGSGKPVVFINARNSGPLTQDAYISFKKGIFVFDDHEDFFHDKLKEFLSRPIEEIKILWNEKKKDRDIMIKDYFTSHKSKNGQRAASMILEEYF
jgi:hypothetical protein